METAETQSDVTYGAFLIAPATFKMSKLAERGKTTTSFWADNALQTM